MKRMNLTVLLVLAIGSVTALGTDYYVDADNPTGHEPPYTNWFMAATNIQFAVDKASSRDTIWVKPGHYRLPTNFVENAGTNVLYIDKPLHLRATGGPTQTFIDGQGLYRCICLAYSLSTATNLLDGFTLTNGYAGADGVEGGYGGGIYFDTGSSYRRHMHVRMQNCVVTDNQSTNAGGGLYVNTDNNRYASLVVSNCVFRNNTTYAAGGAMYRKTWSEMSVYDSLFEGNSATEGGINGAEGGGIRIEGRQLQLFERTVFLDNYAYSRGGALYDGGLKSIVLRNCLLTGNKATYDGEGGAIYIRRKPNLSMYNCTVVNNQCNPSGSRAIIETERTSETGNYGIRMYNCIVYHNEGSADIERYPDYHDRQVFSNNCFESTAAIPDFYAHGNITDEPAFADLPALDLHLSLDSPCLNAGVYQSWMADAVDLDGHVRVDKSYGIVDIGCYERIYRGTAILVQ